MTRLDEPHAVELAPGTHLCATYRGAAQRDEVRGPCVFDGLVRPPQSILCHYDIDEPGAGVVFEAMKVDPRTWLSDLVLDSPPFDTIG